MVWLGWSAGKTAASSNGLVTFYVRCRVDRVICSLMIEMRCPTTHDTTLEQNGKCVLRFFFPGQSWILQWCHDTICNYNIYTWRPLFSENCSKREKNAVHLLKLKGTPEKGKLMKKVARDQVAKNAPAQLEYVQNQRLHIMHFYIIVILDYGKNSGLDHSHMNDYSKKNYKNS